MGIIKLLDEEVSQLIAAGEVVERPSSVVKELVENSIDAGASKVTIEIRHGGVTMIRVSDNGSGIAPEDVPVMFLRHATSKVRTQEDLGHIATLGFRGEAMASIHAVARVEVLTRKQDSDEGVCYRGEGAQTGQVQPAGCPAGTTVKVQDLFYNTPARMKFLKKDVQEGNAVAAVVERIALSHPEISFQFIREGQTRLHTPGDGKLLSAVHAVFGRDFTKDLAEVDYTQGQIHVSGYVTLPSASRSNRTMQTFFVNGRYVKSGTARAALEEAYKHSIMVGKFPACVLNLSIPFTETDINVHPAKIEVRFTNERPVFDAVYYGVKSALAKSDYTPLPPQQPKKADDGVRSGAPPRGGAAGARADHPPAAVKAAGPPADDRAGIPPDGGREARKTKDCASGREADLPRPQPAAGPVGEGASASAGRGAALCAKAAAAATSRSKAPGGRDSRHSGAGACGGGSCR